MTLSISDTQNKNALPCAECHYAECCVLLTILLGVIMLYVVMLSVVMLYVIMLYVVMLTVIMLYDIMLSAFILSVVMLYVVMLSVVAPLEHSQSTSLYEFDEMTICVLMFHLALALFTHILRPRSDLDLDLNFS
jgi:hypothetical protein